MKYIFNHPSTIRDAPLADYLARELTKIRDSINTLYDGYLPDTLEYPGGEDNLLLCTDEALDLGGGKGLYVRIGGQWYRCATTPVALTFPTTGVSRHVGNTPTVV